MGHRGIFSPFKEPQGDGIPSSPLLITPVRQKKYEMYESAIEDLWQQSTEATIGKADRIVVIGYAFPPTDTRPLELVRNTLDSRAGEVSIEIVSPGAQDIASRIGNDHLSKAQNTALHSVLFEEYLEILWGNAPQLMKRAAQQHREVRSWLDRIYMLGQVAQETFPI